MYNVLGISQAAVLCVIPALHAICYDAETGPAPTFAITQILGLVSGVIPATWKQRFSIPSASFITITVESWFFSAYTESSLP